MEIRLTLCLPRDELTIPMIRRISAQAMHVLGVEPECRADLEVAITEASANVLRHAEAGVEYEVTISFEGDRCVIDVVDATSNFDGGHLGHELAAPDSERGRGIQLMRALVDEVRFVPQPELGTVVRLEKALRYSDGSPVLRMSDRAGDAPPAGAAAVAGCRSGAPGAR